MKSFNEKVWALTKKIPKGKISTYKELAKALDCKAYKAVGNALNKNPYCAWGWIKGYSCCNEEDIIPCHRIIKSNGEIGEFVHGTNAKIKLLRKEGIKIRNNKVVDFESKIKRFK